MDWIDNYLDSPEMGKQVLSDVLGGDEAVAFLFVPPLDEAGLSFGHDCCGFRLLARVSRKDEKRFCRAYLVSVSVKDVAL